MILSELLLAGLLFTLIAALYSSVGHAGGTGYLAVMALLSFQPTSIKPTALILNIAVALIASFNFLKEGYFEKKIFIPVVITSIPFAFLGGTLQLSPKLFKLIAGIFLIAAAVSLATKQFIKSPDEPLKKVPKVLSAVVGSVIGFISGLIGIGGGIFLSPIMILGNWTTAKNASGIAALFILVNSLAGLAGHVASFRNVDSRTVYWLIFVISGGLFGSYLGTKKFDRKYIIICLFCVLFSAGIKFIFIDR